jgi:hypothetical protein
LFSAFKNENQGMLNILAEIIVCILAGTALLVWIASRKNFAISLRLDISPQSAIRNKKRHRKRKK